MICIGVALRVPRVLQRVALVRQHAALAVAVPAALRQPRVILLGLSGRHYSGHCYTKWMVGGDYNKSKYITIHCP